MGKVVSVYISSSYELFNVPIALRPFLTRLAISRFFLQSSCLLPIIFLTFIWFPTLTLAVTNVLLEVCKLTFWLLLLLLLLYGCVIEKELWMKNSLIQYDHKLYLCNSFTITCCTIYSLKCMILIITSCIVFCSFYLLMLFTTVATASNIVNVIPANINGTYWRINCGEKLFFNIYIYIYKSF